MHQTCFGRGTCDPVSGNCNCVANYDPSTGCSRCDKCHSDSADGCTAAVDCGGSAGRGQCLPSTGQCACTAPNLPPNCAAPTSSVSAGAVAAGVLLPALALGAAAGIFYWKRANPGRTLASLFGGGGASYSSLAWKPDVASPSASVARASFLAKSPGGGLAAQAGGGKYGAT